jgi:hypothetical protein
VHKKTYTEKMQRKLILPKIKYHILVGYKPKKQSISKKGANKRPRQCKSNKASHLIRIQLYNSIKHCVPIRACIKTSSTHSKYAKQRISIHIGGSLYAL